MISQRLANEIDTQFAAIQAQFDENVRQMLPSHDIIPADGNAVAPKAIEELRPSKGRGLGKAEPLNVNLPADMKFALEVHVYNGPQGEGYMCHLFVEENMQRYHKAIDYGPEGRSHDWREVQG